MGAKLEHALEMCDYGISNPASTTRVDFWRTMIRLDPADYDGNATFYFEYVGYNNTGQNLRLYLHNETDGTDMTFSGTGYVEIATETTAARIRRTVAFTPTSGAKTYLVGLQVMAGSPTIDTSKWYSLRIIVVQDSTATKTRLQIPLCGNSYNGSSSLNDATISVDARYATAYGQQGAAYFGVFYKNASEWADILGDATAWSLEYVSWAQNASYAGNAALGQAAAKTTIVTGSAQGSDDATTALSASCLHVQSFANNATNFSDTTEFCLVMKSAGTTTARKYHVGRAALYVRLSNASGLSKFAIFRRLAENSSGTAQNIQPQQRIQNNIANIGGTGFAVTQYLEGYGYCADATSTAALYVYDNATNWNSTTGTDIANSVIYSTGGTTLTRRRSGAFTGADNADYYILDRVARTNTNADNQAVVIYKVVASSTPYTGDTPGAFSLLAQRTGDTPGAFSLLSARTGDTPGATSLAASRTGDTSGAFSLLAQRTGDTPGAFSLKAARTADTTGAFALAVSRTGDTPGAFALAVSRTGDSPGAFSLRAAFTGDTPGAFALQGARTGDTPGALSLKRALTGDTAGAFALAVSRTGDTPGAFSLQRALTGDTPAAFSLLAARTGDSPGAFSLLAQRTGDTPGAFSLLSARTADTPGAFSLQQIGGRTGDTPGAFSLQQALTGDTPGATSLAASRTGDTSGAFSLLAQRIGDTQGGFSLQRALTGDTTGAFSLKAALVGDSPGAFSLRAAVTADTPAAFSLRRSLTGDTAGAFALSIQRSGDTAAAFTLLGSRTGDTPGAFALSLPAGQRVENTPGAFSLVPPLGLYASAGLPSTVCRASKPRPGRSAGLPSTVCRASKPRPGRSAGLPQAPAHAEPPDS